MLSVGFVGDDVNNSFLNGWIAYNHLRVWDAIGLAIGTWLNTQGRFFPLSMVYTYLFWHELPYQPIEKTLQLLAVLVNIATLAFLVRQITRSTRFALGTAIASIATLQVRFWYDGILSYFILLAVSLECVLLSAIFWLLYIEHEAKRWLLLALMIWAAGLFTYELTYGLTIVNLYIIARYAKTARQRIVGLATTITILVGATLFDIVMRHLHQAAGSSYTMSFTTAIFRAFGIQLLGAIPLSYTLFRPFGINMPDAGALLTNPSALSIICAILVIITGAALAQRRIAANSQARFPRITIAVIGAALWIVPAAIISLSPRWQVELQPGLAYIAVYIEYFGVALLIALIARECLRLCDARGNVIARPAVAAGILVLALTIYATAQANAFSYAANVPVYTNGRANLENALRAGLLDPVQAGSSIVMDNSYLFNFDPALFSPNVKYLLLMYSGKKVTGVPEEFAASGRLCQVPVRATTCLAPQHVYRYKSSRYATSDAWVSIAHIHRMERTGPKSYRQLADSMRVYTSGTMRTQAASLGGKLVSTPTRDAAVYDFVSCPDLSSDELADAALPHLDYGAGFYGPERSGALTFEWAGINGVLSITNTLNVPTRLRLKATLSALAPAHLTIEYAGHRTTVLTGPGGAPLDISALAAPLASTPIKIHAIDGTFRAPGDPRVLAVKVADASLSMSLCGAP